MRQRRRGDVVLAAIRACCRTCAATTAGWRIRSQRRVIQRASGRAGAGALAERQARRLEQGATSGRPGGGARHGEADKVEERWKQSQQVESVEDLLKRVPKHQGELEALAQTIAATVDRGTQMRTNGAKTEESLRQQVFGRGKPLNTVTDAIRLGFELNGGPEIADQIVEHLGKDDHLKVADEGWRKLPDSGYFDRTIKVRFASGLVGEVQLWPPGLYSVKMKTHDLYNELKKVPPTSPQAKGINQRMADIYGPALAALPEHWRKVVP
jgi:hypothetical protein